MLTLTQIDRRLRNIEEILESEDLINEADACKWLGIAQKTIQNKVYSKKLAGAYVISKVGVRMYYKSKLIGK